MWHICLVGIATGPLRTGLFVPFRMVVRIMLMVPIYAIASCVALFSLEAAFVIDAIRDIYEVRRRMSLFHFTGLRYPSYCYVAGFCNLLFFPFTRRISWRGEVSAYLALWAATSKPHVPRLHFQT
jgi:hypothetical protein